MTVGYKRKKKIKTLLFQFFTMYNEGTPDKEMAYAITGEISYLHNIEPEYAEALIVYFNNKYNTDVRAILKHTIKN